MKKLFFLSLVVCLAMGASAQVTTTQPVKQTVPSKPKQVANPAAYACPQCFAISKGAGKCEHCQANKVQLGTYYCFKCQKGTGSKPGTCPDCKGATVQVTRKYCAEHKMKMDAPKADTKM